MRILFIYPNSPDDTGTEAAQVWRAEPLALEYLASTALLDDHEVEILDLRLHPAELEARLGRFQPDLVGVSGFTFHVHRMREICRRVKAWNAACKTAVGGCHATLRPEDFFVPEVDFVFHGEGCFPLRELLRALSQGRLDTPVPGVWHGVEGAFQFGGPREAPELDALPFPTRTLNPGDRSAYHLGHMRPVALLRTSEGCPYRCSFCSLWRLQGNAYRVRSHEAVVEELATIQEPSVHFVDDEPWLKPSRAMAMAESIAASGITKRYFAYSRVDSLTCHPELAKAWRDVGLEAISMGIEAISEHELDNLSKRASLSQIESALDVAHGLGLTVFSLFIVSPSYGEADFRRLARFIERHPVGYPAFTVLTPLPGTDLWDQEPLTARLPDGTPDWARFDFQHAVTATRLPADEFQRQFRSLQMTYGFQGEPHGRTH